MPSNHSPKPLFAQDDGFRQLPSQGSMATTQRDHLEEIPLEKVVTTGSVTGNRKPSFDPNSNSAKLRRPHIGRRKTNNGSLELPGRTDGDEGTLTKMGKIYQKIINFSVVTRYFLYVLPIAILLAVPIIIGIFVAPNATVQGVRIVWFFTWIEIVWLSLWIAKIFAHFVPIVFQFFAGVVSPGVKKYYLVLKALEMPLSFVGWTLASFLSFAPVSSRVPRPNI
jgi:hypothetical protein